MRPLDSIIVTRAGDFEVTVESTGDAFVVQVRGELDLATTPEFEQAVAGATSTGRLVVDLSECTFLDSSAVRALVQAARTQEAAGSAAAIVARDPAVTRVLEIAGLDEVLPIRATVADAL